MSPKPRHYPPKGDEMDSAFYSTVPAADFSCFLDFRRPWFQLPGRLRRQTLRHQEAEMKLPIHCRLPALPRVSRRTAVLALIVALAPAAAAGVAYASIPDSSGVIHGCYKKTRGMLRVIDSATTTCGNDETALTWNQTGPQGPTGPRARQAPKELKGLRVRRARPVSRARRGRPDRPDRRGRRRFS